MRGAFSETDLSAPTGQSSAEAMPQDHATQMRVALQYASAEEMTAQASA